MSAILNESVSRQSQLAAIEAKLDCVVERQRFAEEMIDDMVPVGRQAMTFAATRSCEYEQKGYFAYLGELVNTLDRVVDAYSIEDVRSLSESVVGILDTVRNVTQPDVLAVANDATQGLHDADSIEPLGVFGVVKATRDDDVQRGMAIALQILQHLGKGAREAHHTAPVGRKAAPPPQPAAPQGDVVMWEGRAFVAEGVLIDPRQWDNELATQIAAGLGIHLTEDHWAVLKWVRAFYLESGSSPNVRRVASGSEVGTAAMYQLSPKTPGKSCAMIAGVPKPVGCEGQEDEMSLPFARSSETHSKISSTPHTAKQRHVALICAKGGLDESYPVLIKANAARMVGIKVSIFFAFYGLDVVTKQKVDHLYVNMFV